MYIKIPLGQVLLTEQLIKYAKDDAFFNLHWDMDSATPEEPLPSGSGSELGPGDIIAALNLRCCTTILFQVASNPFIFSFVVDQPSCCSHGTRVVTLGKVELR